VTVAGGAVATRRRTRGALRGLWAARWLLLQWVRRDFTVQYRQSVLGPLWAVVQPLSLLVVYGIVFSQVLNVRPPRGSYLVFALCGLVPWTFVASATTRSVQSLANAAPIIKQVSFPRSVVPLAATGVTVVDLALGTLVLLVTQAVANGRLHLATLSLVVVYLDLVLVLAAISIAGALVGALVRDVRFLVPLILQVAFIATPVMYPRSLVPARFGWVYDLNPISHVIEAVRDAVIDGTWPSPALLAGLTLAGAALLLAAITYSSAIEDRLPDLL
jgi:lipopolysaccharide transport system permease protein